LTDGTCIEAERTITEDGSSIPTKYLKIVDVFSKVKVETLAPHCSVDHVIDLERGFILPYG
jgi:hypothetical protein